MGVEKVKDGAQRRDSADRKGAVVVTAEPDPPAPVPQRPRDRCSVHGAVRSQDCYECFSIDQLATAIRWAARLCVLYGVGDLAEDITIEALMKLRDKWAGVANPIGYLHTTLRNAAADAAVAKAKMPGSAAKRASRRPNR